MAIENIMPLSGSDTLNMRLQALADLQALNSQLLSNASATLTLDRWCEARRIALPGSRVIAKRVCKQNKHADESIRALLDVGANEAVAYRHVHLCYGDTVLSEADNWYVPGRLTPEMNEQLNTTDMSFGRIVQPFKFNRFTLIAKLLWKPLPDGWEKGGGASVSLPADLDIPPYVLEHHAVLKMPDGTPFSALVETYTSNVLNLQSA